MFITKAKFKDAILQAQLDASVKAQLEALSNYNRKIAMCTAFLDHDDKHASFEQYNAAVIKSDAYEDFYKAYKFRIDQYFEATHLIPSPRRLRILLYHLVFVSIDIEIFKVNYCSNANEKLKYQIIKVLDSFNFNKDQETQRWTMSLNNIPPIIIERCYSEEAAIKQARFLNKKQLAIMNSNFIASLFASPALPRVS